MRKGISYRFHKSFLLESPFKTFKREIRLIHPSILNIGFTFYHFSETMSLRYYIVEFQILSVLVLCSFQPLSHLGTRTLYMEFPEGVPVSLRQVRKRHVDPSFSVCNQTKWRTVRRFTSPTIKERPYRTIAVQDVPTEIPRELSGSQNHNSSPRVIWLP